MADRYPDEYYNLSETQDVLKRAFLEKTVKILLIAAKALVCNERRGIHLASS